MIFHWVDASIGVSRQQPGASSFSRGHFGLGSQLTISLRVPSRLTALPRLSALRISDVLTSNGAGPSSPRSSGVAAAAGGGLGRASSLASWSSWGLPLPSSGLVAHKLASLCSETQRAWSASLQSLQSVGRQASQMLRTSSWGRHLAAAAAAAEDLQSAGAAGEPAVEHAQPTLQQFQASLAHFITTASRSEVARATMLSDLSNLAYDVPLNVYGGALARYYASLRLVASSVDAAAAAAAEPAATVAEAAASAAAETAAAVASAAHQQHPDAPAAHALDPSQLASISNVMGVSMAAAGLSFMPMGYPLGYSPMASPPTTPPYHMPTYCYEGEGGTGSMEEDICSAWDAACEAERTLELDHSPPVSPRRAMVIGAMCLQPLEADEAFMAAEALASQAPQESAAVWAAAEPQQAAYAFQAPAAAPELATAASGAAVAAPAPPSAWFVCDDEDAATPTRYFVIQGSMTLDHWRINLTIDPTDFDGPSTGVQVHRGVYEAAEQLYASFAPLVREHLAAHPEGKVCMTGHSLGGSLATVLTLLLVQRGVLPPRAVESVHTFGAPAVFCEAARVGGGNCDGCTLPCTHRHEAAAQQQHQHAALSGLLERLGLAPDAITNVIMHRDVVPRAFVCDYTLVADVLKSCVPSFKHHVGLAACKNHKVLYNFLGNVEVLHPAPGSDFTLPDEGHCMLPPDAALYKLTEPSCQLPGSGASAAALSPACGGVAAVASAAGGEADGDNPMGLTVDDAILAFMNCPHPLQTMREMRAYGPQGSISRFHNPDNYTRALRALI